MAVLMLKNLSAIWREPLKFFRNLGRGNPKLLLGTSLFGENPQGQDLPPEPPMQTGHSRQLFPGETPPVCSMKS
jgi:hypothetical protein